MNSTLILSGLLTLFSITSQASTMKDFKKLYARPSKVQYADDNKYTKEKEILGKNLFFDPRLSGSGMISCGSCHNPSFGWSDGLEKPWGMHTNSWDVRRQRF